MSSYKIIFSGPDGAGKSTAIASVSDEPVVTTDESGSRMPKKGKPANSFTLDYGVFVLDGGDRLQLYGTPGQEQFDFMWDILTTGGIGLILLLDNTRADPLADMRFFLEAFKDYIDATSVVIGVTKMDLSANPSLDDYHLQLRDQDINPPIFELDAREKSDVALLLQALVFSWDPAFSGNTG
jgi:signal recognition particle receptor subunit beta